MAGQTALLVNVKQSWPLVQNGTMTPAQAVLGDWGQLPDDAVVHGVAVVIGVFRDEMVSTFDVKSWKRVKGGRVRFDGSPSTTWAHLVGAPNPGWSFSRRGVARSVQPIPLTVFSTDAEPVEEVAPHIHQALVGGFVLTVSPNTATLRVPRGRTVTIEAA